MEIKNWYNLQSTWKQEKKPAIDVELLIGEVKRRQSLKKLRIVAEIVMVLVAIVFTINRLTSQPDFIEYLILGQIWFIIILALTFNIWNRFSLNIEGIYSHKRYLELLFDHSIKKKRTAIFVFILTVLNLPFYMVLFLAGHISAVILISATGLLIIYTVWSAWYYQTACSSIEHYRERLRKITDQ